MNGNDDDIEDDDVHWNAVINDVPGFSLKLKHILQRVKSRVNMVKEGIQNEAKREASNIWWGVTSLIIYINIWNIKKIFIDNIV